MTWHTPGEDERKQSLAIRFLTGFVLLLGIGIPLFIVAWKVALSW